MENQEMIDKLQDHEKRLTTVEILTEYQSRDIKGNKDSLSSLVKFNIKLQTVMALCVGAYLGWDKVAGLVAKFIGG